MSKEELIKLLKEKSSEIYMLKGDLSEVKRILQRVELSIIEDNKMYYDDLKFLKEENATLKNK